MHSAVTPITAPELWTQLTRTAEHQHYRQRVPELAAMIARAGAASYKWTPMAMVLDIHRTAMKRNMGTE
jgi:hypothetical protein